MTTVAERIIQIIREMTPATRAITEYEFGADGRSNEDGELMICAIIHMCEKADSLRPDDADLVEHAKERMFRMAAMARAAMTAHRKFGTVKMPEADARSLDEISDLKFVGMRMRTTGPGQLIPMAKHVLAMDAARVGIARK